MPGTKKGMSAGSKVAIGVTVALILGGIAYFVLRSSKKKKNTKKCEDAGGTYDAKTKTCVMPVVEVIANPPTPFKEAYKNLNFDTGKATIKPGSLPSLDKVANVLNSDPTLALKLIGYTDNKGPRQYNLDLSDARANAVKSYLIGKMVAEARITAEGKGPDNPIASNDTAKGRLANRRVEFIVGKTQVAPVMDQTAESGPGEPTTPVIQPTQPLTPSVSAGPVTTEVITTPKVPGSRPSNLLDFQRWVINVKGNKTILGGGGSTGFGDDGKWGSKSSKAWTTYGTEYVNK
jgi:outer membrane protein OmpA-like peptidoglycan-associated protein